MTFPEKAYSIPVIYIKFYKKLMKEKLTAKYHVDLKTYREIIYLFNKKLSEALLEGEICELPYGLGELRIKKRVTDIKTARPNIQEFMKTGIKSLHLNQHSDGYRARFFWGKQNCEAVGNFPFSFSPMTGNKRKLSAIMKTEGGHKNYLE